MAHGHSTGSSSSPRFQSAALAHGSARRVVEPGVCPSTIASNGTSAASCLRRTLAGRSASGERHHVGRPRAAAGAPSSGSPSAVTSIQWPSVDWSRYHIQVLFVDRSDTTRARLAAGAAVHLTVRPWAALRQIHAVLDGP